MNVEKEKKWKSVLNKKHKDELRAIADKMDISSRYKLKKDLIPEIVKGFREWENYKEEKEDRFIKIKQLGDKGRECRTFLVKDRQDNKEYAMKTYRKNKPSSALKQEYHFQQIAAKKGISPQLISLDTVNKTITMEKMDYDLVDLLKKQGGKLTDRQEKRIITILKELDRLKIFHMDANPLNFMIKRGKIYIIDYGYSKAITPRLAKKFSSITPNIDYMTISLLTQIKYYYPDSEFPHIVKHISREALSKIEIKEF